MKLHVLLNFFPDEFEMVTISIKNIRCAYVFFFYHKRIINSKVSPKIHYFT